MKLKQVPFEGIKNRTKTLELRLNDEKRQMIHVGDHVEFTLDSDPSQKVLALVKELHQFQTFKDLCYAFDPAEYGSLHKDEYLKMYDYYSKEDESKYGVLGIRVEVI